MSEPITNVADAVRELGALPVPVGPESSERGRLRAAYIEALDNAHQTHPCPVTGRPYWTGCVHYDEAGRVVGVGSCHSERRADAVLAVRDAELERLRAEVAALLAERHSTNEALDDAVQALRASREDGPATDTLPAWLHWRFGKHGQRWDSLDVDDQSYWEHHAEAVRRAVARNGFKPGGNDAALALGVSVAKSADKLTALFAPTQTLREVPDGEHAAWVRHSYRTPHDLPETGGAR